MVRYGKQLGSAGLGVRPKAARLKAAKAGSGRPEPPSANTVQRYLYVYLTSTMHTGRYGGKAKGSR